jgi:hypothetical protein
MLSLVSPRAPRRPLSLVVAVAVTMALGATAGCADQKEKYCDAVKGHQQELGKVLGAGGPDALLNALPIFRDLADEAPVDIKDEWRTVIDALERLEKALDQAGVDPATYERDHPPPGVSQADQEAIDAAARGLTSDQTVTAFSGVDQQAKDVCGIPLQV